MAINLATKFSSKVDEAVVEGAFTGKNMNTDYDFTGVKTIKIYHIETVALNRYSRTGLSRYGVPTELQDTIQELTMEQDYAFTFTIDKGNDVEQLNVKSAAKALKREIKEVVIPMLDKYRYHIFCVEADSSMSDSTAITAANAYERLLNAKEKLMDEGFGENLVLHCTPAYYTLLKEDDMFKLQCEKAMEINLKGQVATVDGVPVVVVNQKRLPAGINFIMFQSKAMIGPMKIQDYKIHKDPVGVNGNLVEGRILFDAFVIGSRKKAIWVQGTRTSEMTEKSNAGYKLRVGGVYDWAGEKVYAKVDSSAITAPTIGDAFVTTGYDQITDGFVDSSSVLHYGLNEDIVGTSTNKYACVVIVDRKGNVADAKAFELDA